MSADTLLPDFAERPYWSDDMPPCRGLSADLPSRVDALVVGGGYCGLAAAAELATHGAATLVLDAADPGSGASTRNGGQVSAANLGKGFSGTQAASDPRLADVFRAMASEAARAVEFVEGLIEEMGNPCHYRRPGRFTGAWTPRHLDLMRRRASLLNAAGDAGARVVAREEQRSEIGSDFFHGGLVLERAGQLHPGLFHRALLDRAIAAGATVVGNTPVRRLTRHPGGHWQIETPTKVIVADAVLVATNGHTGLAFPDLRRRVIPIASHIAATEPMPADLARSVSPRGRALGDSKRVLFYWRLTSDGRRVLFGGRPRFTPVDGRTSARLLHAALIERHPQLKGVRMSHGWSGLTAFTFDFLPHIGQRSGLHFALGCNGSGVATMTWLGHRLARSIINRAETEDSAFARLAMPTRPFYSGAPWFLGVVGTWYRLRDHVDRLRAGFA
jgi:glycine/D-amino acid oxidase-like deaminating enzyme